MAHKIEITLSANSSQLVGAVSNTINKLKELNTTGKSASGGVNSVTEKLTITAGVSGEVAKTLLSVKTSLDNLSKSLSSGTNNLSKNASAVGTLNNSLNKVKGSMNQVSQGVNKVSSAHDRNTSSMSGSIGSMIRMSAVGTLVYGTLTKLTDGLTGFLGALAKYHSDMEQNRIAMETFLGSVEAAKVFMQDLQKMAADTPFELPQLTEASKKMLAFGFAAKDVVPMLTAVGNAVAGLGGGADMIGRVTVAIGQIKAKGRVQGEELLQLAEAGIPVYQILQEKLGLTGDQLSNIAKEGINTDKAIRALIEGMNEKFPNMMAKQADSSQGMLSTIQDNALAIGSILTDNLYVKMQGLIGKVRDFSDVLYNLATKGQAGDALKNLVPADTLETLNQLKSKYDTFLENLQRLFRSLGDTSGPIIKQLGSLFLAALPSVLSFANKLVELANIILPGVKYGCDLLVRVLKFITDNARIAVLALGSFIILTKITVWATTLLTAFRKIKLIMIEFAALQTFTTMTTGILAAVKGVNSLRGAVVLLGTALKGLSRGNIFTVLFALGLAVAGDKIFEMIDKLKGVEGTTDVEAAQAQKEAEEAERQARAAAEEAKGRQDLENHKGSPSSEGSKDTDASYQSATKAAESQISALNNEIDAVKEKVSQSIKDISSRASMEGRELSQLEAQRIAELSRDLEQAEVERYTRQKAIIGSILSSTDTDQDRLESVNKKSIEAQGKIDEAQRKVDQLNASLYEMAKSSGTLSAVMSGTTGSMDDLVTKVEEAGRQYIGPSNYGDNRLDPEQVVCSQLVVKSWEGAGIDNIVKSAGKEWFNADVASWVPSLVEAAKNLKAYHSAGSGYVPKPGDAIIVGADEHHAALINSRGGVINASGREKGVYESDTPWNQQYPDVSGFISISDLIGGSGGIASASQFAAQYARTAKSFTQSSEAWVNAVKNLINKSAEVELALQENSGDITTQGYREIEEKYNSYLQTFKAAGDNYKPMVEKTERLISIQKARVDLQQIEKNWELQKNRFQQEIQLINRKFPDLNRNLTASWDLQKEHNATLQELADKAMEAAKKTGNPEDLTMASQLMNDVKQQAYDFALAQFERVKSDMQERINRINSNPGLTDFEREQNAKDVKQDYSPEIIRSSNAAIEAAKGLGDQQAVNGLRQQKRELSEIPSYYDDIKNAARGALAGGLEEFFETGIFECKNLAEAFRGLAISVIQSIQKINAQRITTMLMKSWFPEPNTDGASIGGLAAKGIIQHFSNGGQIVGEGTGTSDSILARLSNGEFVIKASTVRKWGTRFMHAFNQGVIPPGQLPRFATGGLIGSQSSQEINPIQNLISAGSASAGVKIINVTDPNEVGRYLHTKEGEKVMMNHVKQNAGTYRQILNIRG